MRDVMCWLFRGDYEPRNWRAWILLAAALGVFLSLWE